MNVPCMFVSFYVLVDYQLPLDNCMHCCPPIVQALWRESSGWHYPEFCWNEMAIGYPDICWSERAIGVGHPMLQRKPRVWSGSRGVPWNKGDVHPSHAQGSSQILSREQVHWEHRLWKLCCVSKGVWASPLCHGFLSQWRTCAGLHYMQVNKLVSF